MIQRVPVLRLVNSDSEAGGHYIEGFITYIVGLGITDRRRCTKKRRKKIFFKYGPGWRHGVHSPISFPVELLVEEKKKNKSCDCRTKWVSRRRTTTPRRTRRPSRTRRSTPTSFSRWSAKRVATSGVSGSSWASPSSFRRRPCWSTRSPATYPHIGKNTANFPFICKMRYWFQRKIDLYSFWAFYIA